MKVAFTTSTGETIDEHFGMATRFSIWEISGDEATLVAEREGRADEEDEEDRISARAEVIGDCLIVYTLQIGGPAAAKLIARKIHPMKTGIATPITEVVAKLQEVLRGNPPPWLRKAIRERGGELSGI